MRTFDAYHKWLSIPPGEQPGSHYRLLGLAAFEEEPDIIAGAADSRVRFVRAFLVGEYSEVAQKILNELTAARVCLLNAEKKAAYDRQLRASLPVSGKGDSPIFGPRRCASLGRKSGQSPSESAGLDFLGGLAATARAAPRAVRTRAGARKKRSKNGTRLWLALAIIMAVAVPFALLLATKPEGGSKSRTAGDQHQQTRPAPNATTTAQSSVEKPVAKTTVPTERPKVQAKSHPKLEPPDEITALTPGPSPGGRGESLLDGRKPGAQPAPRWAPGSDAAAGSDVSAGGDELNPKGMGKFITALCQDLQGNLWVGTEDTGVWRYNPAAEASKRWRQFTRANTGGQSEPEGPTIAAQPAGAPYLGDDFAYALACDRLGRIWVGNLNHGVSVYNGQQWRNYDVLTGPLGERVFAIKTCPVDGDVWIATSAGLTRYRLDDDSWSYYTRADGLPADAVQCLAFDRKGTLYAGTQCDGLAIAQRTNDYKHWQRVLGSDALPLAPAGRGLPSNLINDLLVASDGAIYVATTTGLAASRDKGRTWLFLRGQDWEAKARGLYRPPSREQLGAAAALAGGRTLLAEDYVTCLAQDDAGNLCIGHPQKGHEVIDLRTGRRVQAAKTDAADYVTQLLAFDRCLVAGSYGVGLVSLTNAASGARQSPLPTNLRLVPGEGQGDGGKTATGAGRPPVRLGATSASEAPALPSPARPPTAAEIQTLLARLSKVPQPSRQMSPVVVALHDDWRTQGDWLGRYGRYWACCCAICSPSDYVWGAGREPVEYRARIGPHCQKGDSIRYWVHWLYTDNRRSLEMPPTYLHSRVVKGLTTWSKPRRQAEWDDHGEAYPRTHEGPDLYCTLNIPDGLFFLSLYDFNKDGHSGANRWRDYQISIRAHDASAPLYNIDAFERQPELARARIHQFWGGVWKRFLVQGPTQITIRLARNYSHNGILAGVMLDPVDEEPPPYFADRGTTTLRSHSARATDTPLSPSSRATDTPLSRSGKATDTPLSPSGRGAGGEGGGAGEPVDPAAAMRPALDRLTDLQARHPAQWAGCSRRAYVLLLRAAHQPPPGLAGAPPRPEPVVPPQIAGTCAYHCNLFSDWERGQVARGLTPARTVEKALRWDGVSYSCQGRGQEMIEQYVNHISNQRRE